MTEKKHKIVIECDMKTPFGMFAPMPCNEVIPMDLLASIDLKTARVVSVDCPNKVNHVPGAKKK